jgi:hypothetical protein
MGSGEGGPTLIHSLGYLKEIRIIIKTFTEEKVKLSIDFHPKLYNG